MPGADQRLRELGIQLPSPAKPMGIYVRAVQTGNLLFLAGTAPVENNKPKYAGVVGKDLNVEQAKDAAYLACLNALAAMHEYLGSLDRVTKVVSLALGIVATQEFNDHPKVADGASELLVDVFGEAKTSTRIIRGIYSLPLGLPLELELILEVD